MRILESELKELMRFARRVANRYAGRWDPEYESLAYWATYRAIRTFDPSREVPLRGWVAFMTRRALQGHWRRNKRMRTCSNLFWDEMADDRGSDQDPLEMEALQGLSEFDRVVAVEHWVEGRTVKEIAERYGCAPKRLGVYIGKLRARIWALREELEP